MQGQPLNSPYQRCMHAEWENVIIRITTGNCTFMMRGQFLGKGALL